MADPMVQKARAGTDPAPRRRSARTSMALLIGGTGALMLALAPLHFGSRSPGPGGISTTPRELLRNGRFEVVAEPLAPEWGATGSGYRIVPGEGRHGSHAIVCSAADRQQTTGACQTLRLDRASVLPLRVSGWSRALDVDGAPDDNYSLYVSVEYQDGSRLENVSVEFDGGTHGWQRRERLIPALKPVKSLIVHALFRGHTGTVWFDDLSVEEIQPGPETILFQGAPWTPTPPIRRGAGATRILETRDGMRLTARGDCIVSLAVDGREMAAGDSSGFVARDAAGGGPWRPVARSAVSDLGLAVDARWEAAADHVSFEGEVRDLTRTDRAIGLSFLVPVDARGWSWGDDARRSRPIGSSGEFVNAVPLSSGATGSLSRYPVAAVFSGTIGIALAADPESAVQYRVGYHADLRKLFITYDFGLLPDAVDLPSRATFRFVLYRFDPAEGFRGALAGLYSIFPARFARRCIDSGSWLPFTSPANIPRWEDFGFAFREVARGETLESPENLRAFRYTEPLGWWTPLPAEVPRSREAFLAKVREGVVDPAALPREAVERSVMKTAHGLPRFAFRKEPWCDGVLWSLNPNPRLPGRANAALLWWNSEIKARDYLRESAPGAGGEFIDSAEGYAMAELDFDREHLRYSTVPPTFSSDSRVPVLFKGQMIQEYAKVAAREMRELGRFTFGNGAPHRFSFLAPWFDILGAEVDWFPDGSFVPPDDADLSFRRAMAYQKPCCILLNTRLSGLTPAGLEQYFQRCLLYGMFPSLFSHDAQNDSYWSNPALYERDRPLFRKYMPLIRRTAVAGWQPVTGIRVEPAAILLERFGPDGGGVHYITLLNPGRMEGDAELSLELFKPPLSPPESARELLTDTTVPIRQGRLRIDVPAGAVRLLEIRTPAQK